MSDEQRAEKRLMVIDGHALAFRAFHALANAALRTSSGEPTYAVYGFLSILLTLIQEQRPHYVVVAFDVGRTFRDDLYAEYKAGRAETPAEFHSQLARIQQALQALNIPIYTAEGYEADDVIGTLARQATARHLATSILTGDTDTLQLVDEHVRVILANPYGQKTTTTLYDVAKVRERYNGLEPGQLADLRGLKGDASDNIPGVAGIGDKGAMTLLNQFGTIDALYERLDEAPKRYRSKLEGQREQALFSRQLARIVCDVPVTLDTEAAQLDAYDRSAIIALFQELEFGKSLIEKLPRPVGAAEVYQLPSAPAGLGGGSGIQLGLFEPLGEAGTLARAPTPNPAGGTYTSVTSTEQLQEVVAALTAAPGFAFDLESTGLDPLTSAIVGIALAVEPGSAWYIPIAHREGTQLPREAVLAALRPCFAAAGQTHYAHNASFDVHLLAQADVPVGGLVYDTLLVAKLLGRQRVGLKELAFYELKLSEPLTEIAALIGRGKKQITFDQVPIDQALPYAAADADMTLRLAGALQPELAQNEALHTLFTQVESPLIPVLVAMEQAGILLDVAYMRALSARLGQRIDDLAEQIYTAAGERFNINSGLQLNRVLFETLKLPTEGLSKTSTGRFSLSADALERLGAEHAIVGLILQHRHFVKLKSTYVDALPEQVNPTTGRIHTSYNQIGSATGRISSEHPNLQNIPVRSAEGGEIRRAFVAAPGHRFLAADYSQIELRVLAHISQDANLIATFQQGQDIHAATAAQLFGIEPGAVDKHQRRIAKSVVFGVIYGISSFGLAQRTSLSRSEAQALIDAFFARFPAVKTYIESTLERGRRDGSVESLFGRRRAMPELQSSDHNRRAAAEREAINAPIQATAADIMKLAMLRVAGELARQALQSRLLLQVHDELIFEAPEAELPALRALVRAQMEGACTLRVPLRVEIATGRNWDEME